MHICVHPAYALHVSDDIRVTEEGARWSASGAGFEVRARRVEPGLVAIEKCSSGGDADLSTVARAIAALAPGEGGEILSWVRPELAGLNEALRAVGCTLHRQKAFVERDLTGELPDGGAFRWCDLPTFGQPAFLALLMEASEGDPFEEAERDPDREWQQLVEYAGEGFDPTLWRVALLDDQPTGIVLPTAWPKVGDAGTLAYLGVLPAFRQRGLGRALHAAGLGLLAGAGVKTYKGSTDVRNEAMVRVFKRNGCTRKADQLLLHPPRTSSNPNE